jgi:hypothetical protein
MTGVRGVYSIIQYMPDLARAEAANVGVLIYVPETQRISLRISPTLSRVRKFFTPPQAEWEKIRRLVEAFRERFEAHSDEFATEEQFTRFIAARINAIRLTPPRPLIVDHVARNLDELYHELVGDETEQKASELQQAIESNPGNGHIGGGRGIDSVSTTLANLGSVLSPRISLGDICNNPPESMVASS